MLALKKWNPYKELSSLQRELDEFFTRTMGEMSGFGRGLWGERSLAPNVDCFIQGGKCFVQCELPGIDPKDIDISIVGNQLTIKGEKKASREIKEQEYLLNEVSCGTFERTITLPEGVKVDTVHASYKNGILEITMPAAKAELPKKVVVEAGEISEVRTKKAA